MASKDQGQACPLCLRADDPEGMIEIFIPHHLVESERVKLLCRQCAAMIAVTWRTLEDEEVTSATTDQPSDLPGASEPGRPGGDSGPGLPDVLADADRDHFDGTHSAEPGDAPRRPGSTSQGEE